MTTIALRNAWFQVHKWLGIILAIILIPLSISGSMLVWDDALDRLLQPSHHAASGPVALRPAAYLDIGRGALPPHSAITGLSIGEGPVTVSAVQPQAGAMRGPPSRLVAWIDPASGRVVDTGPSVSPLLRWVHVFHGSLQVPGSGRAVVGWLGVAMLISSLTGLWLWWPLQGRWTRGLQWRRQPALDANIHHLVGFWIALPLAILSLTGVIIAWPQMVGGGGARRPMPIPRATTHLTVDQAVAIAGAGGKMTVSWPTDREPAWKVVTERRTVLVDDDSGRIKPGRADQGERPRPLFRRLHDGTGMGFVWQLLIFLAGLAPALLGITGIIMWLRTRKWRGVVARRKAAVQAQ